MLPCLYILNVVAKVMNNSETAKKIKKKFLPAKVAVLMLDIMFY